MVKWNRSVEGFAESKCGRFEIEPLFMGRVSPQAYQLRVDGKVAFRYLNTQKDAKAEAEAIVRFEQAAAASTESTSAARP